MVTRIDFVLGWHYLRQHDNVTVHQIIVQQKLISSPLQDVVQPLHLSHRLLKYRELYVTITDAKDLQCHTYNIIKCVIFFVYIIHFFNSDAHLPNCPKSRATYIKRDVNLVIHDISGPSLNYKLNTLRLKMEIIK